MSRATAPPESARNAARTATRRTRAASVAVIGCAVVAAALAHIGLAPSVYALVGAAINVALAIMFGRTLRAGREPLISTFARAERGVLEPDLVRYTRTLTKVWVGFFVVAALGSLWAANGAQTVASWIAFGTPVAMVVLFVGEWVYRHIRFRHYRHASPLALARIVVAHWRRSDR